MVVFTVVWHLHLSEAWLMILNSAQVVARELLAQYTKQHRDKPLSGLLWSWVASVSDKLKTRYVLLKTSLSPAFNTLLSNLSLQNLDIPNLLWFEIFYHLMYTKSVHYVN